MQTDKLEEKRQKALAEAQEFESQLIAYKKDQEMQNALKTQELEFAKRSVADSQVCERRRQGYAVLCWREVQVHSMFEDFLDGPLRHTNDILNRTFYKIFNLNLFKS